MTSIQQKEMERVKFNTIMENQGRSILTEVIPYITEILKPFIGKKISNADSTLTKKVKELIDLEPFKKKDIKPVFDGDYAGIGNLYLKVTDYNISLKVSLNYNQGKNKTPHYCFYQDVDCFIASIENNILTEIKPTELKQRDVEEELKQFAKVWELRKQFHEENDKLLSKNCLMPNVRYS